MLGLLVTYRLGSYFILDELNPIKGETEYRLEITS
jgi:hypothetical protein